MDLARHRCPLFLPPGLNPRRQRAQLVPRTLESLLRSPLFCDVRDTSDDPCRSPVIAKEYVTAIDDNRVTSVLAAHPVLADPRPRACFARPTHSLDCGVLVIRVQMLE